MNNILTKLFQIFSLRISLNILLAVILFYMAFHMNVPHSNVIDINLAKSVSIISLLLFTYSNNFFLIPRYLAKRRILVYLILAVLLVGAYSFLYSVYIQWVASTSPDIHLYDIVFFTVLGEEEWSLDVIIATALEYTVIYGIWLFVMTMAWFMHDHSRQRKAMLLAQQKQTEAELDFLKSQINPHFLFNTLNNLYALAMKKSDKAPDAILKLSSILRYLTYESDTSTVSFEKEREIIQAYIDIELLRLDNTDQLTFSISADGPYQIPPLLWLPVLENVFKHGTRTIADDNFVEFRYEIKDKVLSIYSKNKEKMLVKTNEAYKGIGLKNMGKRLELLYPGKHNISVRQEDHCHILDVKIDLS